MKPPSTGPPTLEVTKTRGDIGLVAAALLGRDDVGDDRLGERDQPAAAETLEARGRGSGPA